MNDLTAAAQPVESTDSRSRRPPPGPARAVDPAAQYTACGSADQNRLPARSGMCSRWNTFSSTRWWNACRGDTVIEDRQIEIELLLQPDLPGRPV